MITHDAAVAEHAGRVVRMADGRFAEDRRVASPRDAESELRAAPSASPVS
jgi:ABC-type lipoprotein export system ATPase subunit